MTYTTMTYVAELYDIYHNELCCRVCMTYTTMSYVADLYDIYHNELCCRFVWHIPQWARRM